MPGMGDIFALDYVLQTMLANTALDETPMRESMSE